MTPAAPPTPTLPAQGLLDAFDDPSVGGVGGSITSHGNGQMDRFIEVERLVDHGRDLGDTVDYLVTANAAFRRTALEQVGGFDEDFGSASEDVDLSWRVRAKGWRLTRSDATVVHHQRSSVSEILDTYRKHGRGRALLDHHHPDQGAGGSALRAVDPSELVGRWKTYRTLGTGRVRSAGFIGLRYLGLGAYALALLRARR